MSSENNKAVCIGVTNNLERRCYEHKNGLLEGFTKKYKCHKLVYFEATEDIYSALSREKQLKRWSRNKKNELISTMNEEYRDLSASLEMT
jgi:putative endonuclease